MAITTEALAAPVVDEPANELTYDAYMAEPQVEGRYSIVNGVREYMAGATWRYQRVSNNISRAFYRYEQSSSFGTTVSAPFDVLIRRFPKLQTRQPDVLFISQARMASGGADAVSRSEGPFGAAPELVVERLSRIVRRSGFWGTRLRTMWRLASANAGWCGLMRGRWRCWRSRRTGRRAWRFMGRDRPWCQRCSPACRFPWRTCLPTKLVGGRLAEGLLERPGHLRFGQIGRDPAQPGFLFGVYQHNKAGAVFAGGDGAEAQLLCRPQ